VLLTRRRALVAAIGVGALGLVGCGQPSPGPGAAPSAGGARAASASPSPDPVEDARVGAPAPSTRVRFVPTSVTLPGGASAPVRPARTVDGELVVPEEVAHVGWWDGSAEAGDPFGSTVIAGHVDSASEGLGFFAHLRTIARGDVVTVRAGRHSARYRVHAVRTVAKQALATSGSALQQDGDHQLVLITCGGGYRADRGGYDSNVVVTARPLGPAR